MTSISIYDQTAYRVSELVTKIYSTSFYRASRLFDRDTREAIFAIYGFVRFADEIVDTFTSGDPAFLLKKFDDDNRDALQRGISLNPVLHSFQQTVGRYQIPHSLIADFLSSMKQDLNKKTYHTREETAGYIYGSADVVGLMCLRVFVRGNEGLYDDLRHSAQKLGTAFQKVNFLRDLKNDMEILDRNYFPGVDFDTFDEDSKLQLVTEIRQDFDEALEGIVRLPSNARLAVYVAYRYYTALLNKIRHTPAKDVLHRRIRINNGTKTWLLVRSYFENLFNQYH